MNQQYTYEPYALEIALTNLLGNSILKPYYANFVRSLDVKDGEKVMDYCAGSGIISKMIAKKGKGGALIYTDVSQKWLAQASRKVKRFSCARGVRLKGFHGLIEGGEYDKIVVHFSLHDFPSEVASVIVHQLIENLGRSGVLVLREPIGKKHGIELHRIVNLLESTKKIDFEYDIEQNRVMGDFVDIRCRLK